MNESAHRKNPLDTRLLGQFCQRSNGSAAIYLCVHFTVIGMGAALVWAADTRWLLLPAWIIYGTALVFLFAPLHECIHRTAFRSRRANDAVAMVCGFLLLLPARYFRTFHFAHHRFTNDPDRDPELQTAKPENLTTYIWAMSGIGSYWWPQIRSILRHAQGRAQEKFIPEADRIPIIREARSHLMAYAALVGLSILLETTVILHYHVIPALFGMIALRLFLLAEHTGCELTDDMFQNTRTTRTNPVVNFLAWNMPYHCEHHVYPAVPFHQLPTLHRHLQGHLGVVSDGYRGFHREFLKTIRFDQR